MKMPSVITGVFLAVSALAAASPTIAAAHGPVAFETRYYSNGELVGLAQHFCDGHDYAWGDLTQIENESVWYSCD